MAPDKTPLLESGLRCLDFLKKGSAVVSIQILRMANGVRGEDSSRSAFDLCGGLALYKMARVGVGVVDGAGVCRLENGLGGYLGIGAGERWSSESGFVGSMELYEVSSCGSCEVVRLWLV
ncbi:hypothetical protein Tco_1233579 [Tanacetum coccineum]